MHNAYKDTGSALVHASRHCPAFSNCLEGFTVVHSQARRFRTTAGRPACMLLQASKVGTPVTQCCAGISEYHHCCRCMAGSMLCIACLLVMRAR